MLQRPQDSVRYDYRKDYAMKFINANNLDDYDKFVLNLDSDIDYDGDDYDANFDEEDN